MGKDLSDSPCLHTHRGYVTCPRPQLVGQRTGFQRAARADIERNIRLFSFVFIESGNLPDHFQTLDPGERLVRGNHEGPRGGTGTLRGDTSLPSHRGRQTGSALCTGSLQLRIQ